MRKDHRATKLPSIKVRPETPQSRDASGKFYPDASVNVAKAERTRTHPANPQAHGRRHSGEKR
jgi:hypothetical protein